MEQNLLEEEAKKIQTRYSDAINQSLSQLDKKFLRRMQSFYFGCGKKCCDNESWSTENVQRCVERCEVPVSGAQNLIQSELSSLQNRLQTCVQECAHRTRDRLSQDDIGDAQMIIAQKERINCSKTCIDEQINISIPSLMERVSGQLKQLHSDQLKASF